MRISGLRIFLLSVAAIGIAAAAVIMVQPDRSPETSVAVTEIAAGSGIFLSARVIDFGEIEISSSARRTVMLTNRGDRKILLREISLVGPFSLPERINLIPAGESRSLAVYFRPEQVGSSSGKLMMEVIGEEEGIFEIALTGIGLPLAGDGLAMGNRTGSDRGPGSVETGSAVEMAQMSDSESAYPAEMIMESTQDSDDVDPAGVAGFAAMPGDGFATTGISGGVQADGRQKKQTGPGDGSAARPIKTKQFTREEYSGVFGYAPSTLQQQAFSGSDAVQEDVFDQDVRPARFPPREPDFGDEEQGEDSKRATEEDDSVGAVPRLVIAANSLLSVAGGGQKELPGQNQSLTTVDDETGTRLALGGRLVFPQVPLAFDQIVGFEQWGDVQGFLDPSGHMVFHLTLRITDPNDVVIDLPMELTTREAIGWTSPDTAVYLSGRPLDPVTGMFELVGIQNVPPGLESAIQSKPIMLSVIGRMDNL